VSLKGSLETIALPEVLHLLADTGKSGELRVSGTRDGGRLWFDAGLLSGFDVGSSPDPADALFQLLRVDTGEFSFDADASLDQDARTVDDGAQDVRPALETAQARLAEWVEIVSVVPSLDHHVKLVEESPRDEVVLDRFQWSLLVAVGEGHPVQHVLDVRGLPEFDGCKALKGLVDASLVEVSEPVVDEGPAVEAVEPHKSIDADDSPGEPSAADEHRFDSEPEPVFEAGDGSELVFEADQTPEPVFDGGYPAEVIDEHVLEEEPAEEDVVEDHPGVTFEAADEAAIQPLDDPALYAEEYGVNGADPVSEAGAVDGDAPAEVSEEPESDGREAMRALLAELSPQFDEPAQAPVSEPVDGLMDRGPWTASELEQMSGWQRNDGKDVIAWPDDERASDPVAPAVQESVVAFHPGSVYDSDGDSEQSPGEGYQLADFGFPLRSEARVENGHADPIDSSASAHAAADEQGVYESEPEEEPEQEPAEEPMNRGLLLKFLSSVRN
jgi:Domain of unknown function (DUF4388)